MTVPTRTVAYDVTSFSNTEFDAAGATLVLTPTVNTTVGGVLVPAVRTPFAVDGSGTGTVELVAGDLGEPPFNYRCEVLLSDGAGSASGFAKYVFGTFRVPTTGAEPLSLGVLIASGIPPAETEYWQSITQEEYDAAIGAVVLAEAAALAASIYAPAYYPDPNDFFTDGTVWPVGTRINARSGEAWDIVASGEDFLHPTSSIKVKAVEGGVRAYGLTGTADDFEAVVAASGAGRADFKRFNNADYIYTIAGYTAGDFDGAVWSAEPGVQVDTYFGLEKTVTGQITFATDVPMPAALEKSLYIGLKTLPDYSKNCIPMPQVANFRRQRPVDLATEVVGRAVEWPAADTFTSAAGSGSGQRYTVTATGGEGWRGAFVEIGPWETISGVIEGTQPGNIGVIIRGTEGYAVVYGNVAMAAYTSSRKSTGIAVSETSVSWSSLGQGSSTHYAPKKAAWAVSRIDAQRAIVTINGQQLCEAQNVGDIYEVGFVAYNNTGDIVVAGLSLDRRTDMRFGIPRIQRLGIFGDSMAEDQAGSWGRYVKQRLHGLAGLRIDEVANYAVGGTDLAALVTALTANISLVDSPVVPIFSGTNDIQLLTPIATFETRVAAALAVVTGAGKIPVWMIPWQYYGQTQAQVATGIVGHGQNAVNYDAGAVYREILKRMVTAAGGVFFDAGSELPYADPSDLILNPENPFLRDNIHPDAMAYQLFAIGVTQRIADYYLALPESIEGSLPAGAFLNGTDGSDLRYAMDKAGMITLFGSLYNSATTDQSVLQLPRWMRPNVAFNVGYFAIGATDTAAARGLVSGAGLVTQADVPTGTTVLVVNSTYRAAI